MQFYRHPDRQSTVHLSGWLWSCLHKPPGQMQAVAVDPTIASLEHCRYCFDVLLCHLNAEPFPPPVFEDANCPLFVTWNKCASSDDHYHLRGCIGTLEPRMIRPGLKDYALTSAFRDSRFSPIQLKEAASLRCTVSLLRCFEQASSWSEWEVGVHGIIINFVDPVLKCKRSATFLPEVAAEQQWTKEQCVDALIRKAGYDGVVSADLRKSLKLTKYQSTAASLTYLEYCHQKPGHAAVNLLADGRLHASAALQ